MLRYEILSLGIADTEWAHRKTILKNIRKNMLNPITFQATNILNYRNSENTSKVWHSL